MTTLKKALHLLTGEMKKQECYQKYQESLKRLKEDKELYQKVNEFREKNIELHMKKRSLREEAGLERQYHELLCDSVAGEFLYWEQEMLKMLRQIHCQVDEVMELDYDFL